MQRTSVGVSKFMSL